MERVVVPEILDSLAADDPEAIQSRAELRLINSLMGNHRWLAKRVRRVWKPGMRVLEVGAGDGGLGARLARWLPPGCLTAIDLAPRPRTWPADAHWQQTDLFAGPLPDAEIIVANLFLHHFTPENLARLGGYIPPACRTVLCCEPARRRLHLWQGSALAWLARFGRVTRHDMPVSIGAGFIGNELPRMLGLGSWRFHVSTTLLGAYRCRAYRI